MSDQDKTKEKYVVDFIKAFDENERAMEPFKEHRRDLRKNYVENGWLYQPKSPYVQAKVLDFAHDCKIKVRKNQIVVVDNSMIQEIEINKKTNFVVLENYVVGLVEIPLKEALKRS